MSAGVRNALRKIAILLATALAMLGWATVAAAQNPPPTLPDNPDSGEPTAGQKPAVPPGDDAKDGDQNPSAAADRDDEQTPSVADLLAKLPKSWDKPELLAQAAIEINSMLAQAERQRKLIPWKLADGFRRSLVAGRQLAEQIDPGTRAAYFQSLYFAAAAAGYPGEAMAGARELAALDPKQGWNWLAVYRAGMLTGDKPACDEAVDALADIVGQDRAALLKPMKEQAGPIGQQPTFTIPLSDGTKFKPADARGKVVVFDFWMYQHKTYSRAFPLVRRVYRTFQPYADFRMIGVNMDSRQFRNVIDQYIRANGMVWPQYFEGHGERTISFKVFKSRRLPSQAVLSPTGKVIFLGQPNDSMLYYAVRAGLVQANRGRIPTSQPEDGPASAAPGPGPRPPQTAPAPADPADAAVRKAEREKAARQQLRLAEAFEAADFKPKAVEIYRLIVRKYPETNAAVVAKARLLRLVRWPDRDE